MANSIVSFTPEPELFELLEDLIIVHNLEGRIRYINRYVQKLLGYSPYDVLNKSILNFLPNRYKEKYLHYLQSIKREKYLTGVVVVLTEKGQERLLEYRNAVYFRDGKPEGVVGICRDYTQRERMEKALTEAMGRFESIIKHTPMVAVQGFDANGCIYHWNPVSEKLYGMSIKEVLEKPFHKLFLKGKEERKFLNDLKWVFDRGLPVENREFAINTANGEKRWVYSSMFPVFEGGRCLEAIRMEMDITERKKVEERLEYLSTHDPLTGIYNRAYFEEEMRRLENPRFRPVSIIVCDVDDLKLINDTFGHGKGDSLLKAVAETIKSPFRSSDVIARIGGDEFVILLPLTSMDVAKEACRRINESIEEYNRKNPELPLSVSLGVSTNTDPDIPLVETFKEADSDMYNNKINACSKSAVVYSLLNNVHEKLSIPPGYRNNMQSMAVTLAKEAGLRREDIAAVAVLSLVHDIGKVAIPDNIIYKKGALLPQERKVMEKHPLIGQHIALSSSEIEVVANYILSHHEWWNGGGYPNGLKAHEIPLPCRIVAIVEAYNAMTSERPYRKALSHEEAISEIKRCSGTQFDPQLVEYFLKLFA